MTDHEVDLAVERYDRARTEQSRRLQEAGVPSGTRRRLAHRAGIQAAVEGGRS